MCHTSISFPVEYKTRIFPSVCGRIRRRIWWRRYPGRTVIASVVVVITRIDCIVSVRYIRMHRSTTSVIPFIVSVVVVAVAMVSVIVVKTIVVVDRCFPHDDVLVLMVVVMVMVVIVGVGVVVCVGWCNVSRHCGYLHLTLVASC